MPRYRNWSCRVFPEPPLRAIRWRCGKKNCGYEAVALEGQKPEPCDRHLFTPLQEVKR